MRDELKYWSILVAAGLAWGITFSFAKIATEGGMHPVSLNFWQALIGFVSLRLYLLLRGQHLPFTSKHLVFYSICGLLGTALPGTLLFFAATSLSAGILSIAMALVPILTVAIAIAIGIEQVALFRLLGILFGAVAIVLIVAPDSALPDPESAPWVLVAVVAALCYAIESLYIAVCMPRESDAQSVLCGMFLTGTLMTGLVALATDNLTLPTIPFTSVEGAVIAMAVINVVAYSAFIYLVAEAGPVFASQMAYLVTASGVAWGAVLFNEQHSGWIWTAMLVIMAGLALVKPRESLDRR